MWSPTETALALAVYVPAVYVSYRIFRTLFALFWSIFVYVIAPVFYKPNFNKYKKRWTVVTGGTDGIGKAYTFELARRGLRKFVLIGRNEKKLEDVKIQLESEFEGCRVNTFKFDFETDDFKELREFLTDVDVGFAVNSVGVGREFLERFGDRPEADSQILKVNALGAAEFLSAVLPPMERGGGGQIVVLSSSQGCRPIPLLAAYSSAKSLLSFLCECIDREYKTIRVQCLTPALVATNMTYYEKGSMFVVTTQAFARQAVNTVGFVRVTSGCLNHEIQMLLMHLFPWSILKYLIMPIYWRHQKRMIHLHGRPPVLAAKPGLKNDITKAEEASLAKESGSVEDVSVQA